MKEIRPGFLSPSLLPLSLYLDAYNGNVEEVQGFLNGKVVMSQAHSAVSGPAFTEEVELQGHIIDSLLLPKVLDEILTRGGTYVIKDIQRRPTAGRSQPRPHRGPGRQRRKSSRRSSTAIHDHGAVPIHAQRLHGGRRRHGRRLSRGLLQHHQLSHPGPPRRRMDRGRGPGDGLRHPGRSRGAAPPAACP